MPPMTRPRNGHVIVRERGPTPLAWNPRLRTSSGGDLYPLKNGFGRSGRNCPVASYARRSGFAVLWGRRSRAFAGQPGPSRAAAKERGIDGGNEP